jgi:uncharacterized protein with HEPN domain
MQPEARDPVCVIDMLSAARGVVRSLQDVSLAKYQSDQDLRHAVERKIEIMGEAARRLSDGLREKHPEIPWRAIIGQRNVLIHGYDQVDDERVWRLAETHIASLIPMLETVLRELGVADES